MPFLQFVLLTSFGVFFLAGAVMLVVILRRGLKTGSITKGQCFMPGYWTRANTPVKFKIACGFLVFGALDCLIVGATFITISSGIYFGYWK
jgi:hypothetical protein